MHSIQGAFDDQKRADAAVQALLDVGFPSTDIQVSERRRGETKQVPVVWHSFARRWGVGFGALGALLGAVFVGILPQLVSRWPALAVAERFFSDSAALAPLQGAFLGALALGVLGAIKGVMTFRTSAAIDEDASRVWVGVETNQGDLERAANALRGEGARELERT